MVGDERYSTRHGRDEPSEGDFALVGSDRYLIQQIFS